MPSTQEKKIHCQSARSDLYGAGGEPPGEPPAPPLRSAEASRLLSEEVVEETLGRARLGRSVAGMSDREREELVDGLLDQLGAGRDEGDVRIVVEFRRRPPREYDSQTVTASDT
jgi:hypothetical protein